MFGKIAKFFGGTVTDVAKDVNGIFDEWIESDEDRREDKKWQAEMQEKRNAVQNAINQIYAKKGGFFMAGARPATLWVCLIIMIYLTIAPALGWTLPPDFMIGTWMTIFLSLLGIRTAEKKMNIDSK